MKNQPIILAIILGIISLTSCNKKTVKPVYHTFNNETYVVEEELDNFNLVNTTLKGHTKYLVLKSTANGDSIRVTNWGLTNNYIKGSRVKTLIISQEVTHHASRYRYFPETGIVLDREIYKFYPIETVN
jgi:hypothetical protein